MQILTLTFLMQIMAVEDLQTKQSQLSINDPSCRGTAKIIFQRKKGSNGVICPPLCACTLQDIERLGYTTFTRKNFLIAKGGNHFRHSSLQSSHLCSTFDLRYMVRRDCYHLCKDEFQHQSHPIHNVGKKYGKPW